MFPLNLPNFLTVVRIVLVYAAVGVTVVSGADYFLNVRRLEEARTA